MANYRIVTDSCCDLTAEWLEKLGVSYTPLSYVMCGETHENRFGEGQSISEFYGLMRRGEVATTNAPNIEGWTAVMEAPLARGEDVLAVAFSSGLSSTYSTACIAAEDLREKYPARSIYVVDTLAASSGQGLLLYHAVQRKNAGASLSEVRDWLEENKLHMAHWFTVDDLQYLKRGGRVSGATALIATVLNIKPVMHMDDEGHLVSVTTVRGRKKSMQALVDQMKQTGIDVAGQTVFLCHGDATEDVRTLETMLREQLGVTDTHIFDVGPVIGAHSGPGTLSIFFLAEHR